MLWCAIVRFVVACGARCCECGECGACCCVAKNAAVIVEFNCIKKSKPHGFPKI